MADSSSTFVQLGAQGPTVTTAGVFFVQAGTPPAGQVWWNWDGTNLVGNVPTGGGFSFTVNGAQVAKIGTGGDGTFFAANPLNIGNSAFNGPSISAVGSNLAFNAGGAGASVGLWRSAAQAGAHNLVGQLEACHLDGGSAQLSVNTCLIGLGAGTTSSGTAVTASGHDMAARVGVTVNSTGTVSQPILLASFAQAYASPPFMSLDPGNAAAATIPLNTAPFIVPTTSGWSIMANTTGIAAGTYVWYVAGICQ
jgi:hypothetical protein